MKTILIASYKGGVGKSTIANFLAEKLSNAVILNLDIYQDNEDYNSSKTINVNINDNLQNIITQNTDNDFCIIDAGGFDDERLYNIDVDLFIFVTRTDYRSIKTTVDTAATLLNKSSSKAKKAMFLINQYENEKEFNSAVEILKQILEISDITANEFYSVAIKKSNAITTAINNKTSLNAMYSTNKAAYKSVNKQFDDLANEVKNIVKD